MTDLQIIIAVALSIATVALVVVAWCHDRRRRGTALERDDLKPTDYGV